MQNLLIHSMNLTLEGIKLTVTDLQNDKTLVIVYKAYRQSKELFTHHHTLCS